MVRPSALCVKYVALRDCVLSGGDSSVVLGALYGASSSTRRLGERGSACPLTAHRQSNTISGVPLSGALPTSHVVIHLRRTYHRTVPSPLFPPNYSLRRFRSPRRPSCSLPSPHPRARTRRRSVCISQRIYSFDLCTLHPASEPSSAHAHSPCPPPLSPTSPLPFPRMPLATHPLPHAVLVPPPPT